MKTTQPLCSPPLFESGRERQWRIAQNRVYHDARRPSHIVLPVA